MDGAQKKPNLATKKSKLLRDLVSLWSSQNESNFENYCCWARTPQGPLNGEMAFVDFLIEIKDGWTIRRLKSDSSEFYVYIPNSLAYKPSQDSQDWFLQFFVTCVAGNEDGANVELAIESLAIRGLRLPHHIVI